MNSGSAESKAFGALTHIGQDETIAGEAVGDELNKRGRKKALCVLHEQGNVGHEQRCAGAKKTFDGTMQNLYVEGTNMPDVQSSIEAKLQADKSIDARRHARRPLRRHRRQGQADAGSKAEIDTFDLNAKVATALKDGTLGFAVDQQPYLQGYEAVDLLWLYQLQRATSSAAAQPVLTGPQIITKDDAAELARVHRSGAPDDRDGHRRPRRRRRDERLLPHLAAAQAAGPPRARLGRRRGRRLRLLLDRRRQLPAGRPASARSCTRPPPSASWRSRSRC